MGAEGMLGSISWWVAAMVAANLVSAPALLNAASTGPVPSAISRPEEDVILEVEIGPGIVEATELRRWITEEGRRILDGLPKEPARRGQLQVEVAGALYEYRVTIAALREDRTVSEPSAWTCDCSNEELLEKLRIELPRAAGLLEVEAERVAPVPDAKPAPPVASMSKGPERRREGLGAAGAVGVALMSVGASGLATGIAFMVIGEKDVPPRLGRRETLDFMNPGQLVAVGSGGMLLSGILLHVFRKRIDRGGRASLDALAPTFDGSNARLTFTGRF